MKPLISVVIATWQRPALLSRCLQELIDQSMDKSAYEIIVVTDGPDTRSMECVQQLAASVYECPAMFCTSLTKKSGPAAARNAGWKRASGELIVFTDDDCLPLFFFLENYWNAYVLSGWSSIAFSGQVEVPLPPRPSDYAKNVGRLAEAGFVTANCACTRKALEQVGGLDEEFTMAWREDSALEFTLLEHNIPIVEVPAAIVVHPVREAPWGVCLREEKKNMYNALLYKKFPRLYSKRIGNQLPWHYYAMVLLAVVILCAVFIDKGILLALVTMWLILVTWFAGRRLQGTSGSPGHVLEMLYTSMIIPFLSIYWNWYGRIKFKSSRL